MKVIVNVFDDSNSTFTCSESTIETSKQNVKSLHNQQQRHQNIFYDFAFVSLLLILNRFHTLFWCFCCQWSTIIRNQFILCRSIWLSLWNNALNWHKSPFSFLRGLRSLSKKIDGIRLDEFAAKWMGYETFSLLEYCQFISSIYMVS